MTIEEQVAIYAVHAAVAIGGNVMCVECGTSWPCDQVVPALAVLLTDTGFAFE